MYLVILGGVLVFASLVWFTTKVRNAENSEPSQDTTDRMLLCVSPHTCPTTARFVPLSYPNVTLECGCTEFSDLETRGETDNHVELSVVRVQYLYVL